MSCIRFQSLCALLCIIGIVAVPTRAQIVRSNVDLRVLKMIPIGAGHLDVVVESFNLLNHRNVSLLNATFGSESQPAGGFGSPIWATTPRRIQFSLDYEF